MISHYEETMDFLLQYARTRIWSKRMDKTRRQEVQSTMVIHKTG